MSKDNIFSWPVRVYFQDTDAGGVVYYANYLKFMERARAEWLRTLGYTNATLKNELGVLFVVRTLKLDYLKPALLDDMLSVTVQLKDAGRSRVTLLQSVWRGDEVLSNAEVQLVCVSAEGFRPVSVPEALRKQWV